MAINYSGPGGFAEIWPFEGGPIYLQGQQLLAFTTNKNIKDNAGTFTIELAPGGPLGPNQGPTWLDIITPMSFVLLGLSRNVYKNIVMLGVVTSISEEEEWPIGPGNRSHVTRKVVIYGVDFGKFFMMVNWLALVFLGGVTAPAASSITGLPADAALGFLNQGLLKGPPDQVATHWFTEVMSKTLSKTYVTYHQQQVTFPSFMAYWFQAYPFTIPMSDYYMATEGNWMEKFRQILQFPWFEVFVNTAPSGFYTQATGGHSFTMQMLGPSVSAEAYIVGRVNPLPFVPASVNGQIVTYGSVDASLWNGLPLFIADTGFIKSSIHFDESEVRNFYILNPVFLMMLWGQQNAGGLAPFTFQNAGAADFASIVRYGYRPESVTSRWFADPTGEWAQSQQVTIYNIVANLMAKLTSYYEPTPLMAKTEFVYPLRPDVIIGSRWRCSPGKGEPLWDFYVEGISHHYIFGGPSVTQITATRGLPTTIYADTSQGGVLTQMHLGNAQRVGGSYQVGLPAGSLSALQSVNIGNAGTLATLTGASDAWYKPQIK